MIGKLCLSENVSNTDNLFALKVTEKKLIFEDNELKGFSMRDLNNSRLIFNRVN